MRHVPRFLTNPSALQLLSPLALVLSAAVASAETLTVCPDGSCDYTNIQTAIDAAVAGDIVEVLPGLYSPSAPLLVSKAITLRGGVDAMGDPTTLIDGSSAHRVISCSGSQGGEARFENLLIQNGAAGSGTGGGLRIGGASPTLINCHFVGNTAYMGGGVYSESGSPVLEGCEFRENHAGKRGGGMCNLDATAQLTGCAFIDNSADQDGAGLYNYFESDARIEGCTFTGNIAGAWGGAVLNEDSGPAFIDCNFTQNTASEGGGIRNHYPGSNGSSSFTGCLIEGNQATSRGGGVYDSSCSPDYISCTLTANLAGRIGGGMYTQYGAPALLDTQVCGNAPGQIDGTWVDVGGNTVQEVCPTSCIADLNGDGLVGGADLGLFLTDWGPCGSGCAADFDGSGVVDGVDMGLLLAGWGPCP